MAAPNRSQKWRLTSPGNPARPNSSAPGELSGTTTPAGVRASVQSTKTREDPCCTWPRVSPMSFVPRSSSTTLPSTPKVSVAITQVVIPGESGIDGRFQRAVDERALGQQQPLRRQDLGAHGGDDTRAQQADSSPGGAGCGVGPMAAAVSGLPVSAAPGEAALAAGRAAREDRSGQLALLRDLLGRRRGLHARRSNGLHIGQWNFGECAGSPARSPEPADDPPSGPAAADQRVAIPASADRFCRDSAVTNRLVHDSPTRAAGAPSPDSAGLCCSRSTS